MEKKLSLINTGLLLVILLNMVGGLYLWLNPKYPSEVDGSALAPAARPLEKPSVIRKTTPIQATQEVASHNVFRTERTEFQEPSSNEPAAAAPAAGEMPPPNISLKGVLLAGGAEMAIFNGTYPVRDENNQIQEKPLKRKGYRVGDAIAGYQVQSIDKNAVTLGDQRGTTLTLNVSQRNPAQKIQKAGTRLFHKDPNAKEMRRARIQKIENTTAPVPRNQPPAPTVSPAPTAPSRPVPAPRVSISGNPMPTAPLVRR